MVEGLVHKLLNTKDKTYWPMLSLCDIHIIPMLNPDGVVAGNSTCNFGGVDINRRWGDNVLKNHVTPEVSILKDYLLTLGDKVSMFIDMQAHASIDGLVINASQSNNINSKIKKDEAVDAEELDNWFLQRAMPKWLHINSQFCNEANTKFNSMDEDRILSKHNCGRSIVFHEL